MSAPAEAAPPPCLIINPRSSRASRGLAGRAAASARAQGAEVVLIDDRAALSAAVRSILARRQRHVLILAGDGTVQGVVEQLAREPAGAWLPELLVLPGGRSNLTAADLVPHRDPMATMARALEMARGPGWEAALVERALLRVEQAPAPARYGFFVAGALIDTIIRRTHVYLEGARGPLHTGHLSVAWFVLGIGVRALFGRAGLPCPTLDIEAGSLGRLQAPARVLLMTTLLHRRGGLFNPYAARGDGALRMTAVAEHARGFWRALPRLLTGRFSTSMSTSDGYLSGRCAHLRIAGLAGYCLDGEEIDTDPTRPVLVTPGPRLRLLSL